MKRANLDPGVVYQPKVTLDEIEPPISRRIHVSGDTTLSRLHTVIQKVMGWKDAHLHEFEVKGRRYGVPDPNEPEYEVEHDWRILLRETVPVEGMTFRYIYDLGDNWTHEILVEKIETPTEPLRYPVCLSGERRCPPEDCGGAGGYEVLLEAIRDPAHPEHEDMLRWAGRRFDAEAFDLAAVNRKLRLLK